MSSLRTATRARAWARSVLAVTLALVATVLVRASSQESPFAPSSQAGVDAPGLVLVAPLETSSSDIARLIARDPFSPLRAAPDVPYRIGAAGTDSIFMRSPVPVRLLGTIVRAAGRSFAMCRIEGEPARVVYPGDRIGELTLESVSQGSANFIDDAGARVVLRVPRTGG